MGGSSLWTWGYLAQQVIVLSLWLFLLSGIWKELRAWRAVLAQKSGPAKNDGLRIR